MQMEPVQRRSLADQAVRSIFSYIQKNDLKGGTVLPAEGKLAKTLGVSRPVVREAVRTLVGKGVIEMINGVGAVVRELDSSVLAEFFDSLTATRVNNAFELEEARHGLEMHAAMLAAKRRTDQDLKDLEAILIRMREKVQDKFAYADLNAEFHKTIARATGNPVLKTLLYALLDSLAKVMAGVYAQVIPQNHWQKIHHYHEEIFDHIKNQEPNKARDATLAHLLYSLKKF